MTERVTERKWRREKGKKKSHLWDPLFCITGHVNSGSLADSHWLCVIWDWYWWQLVAADGMRHIFCVPFLLWPLMIHIWCGLLSYTTPCSICIWAQEVTFKLCSSDNCIMTLRREADKSGLGADTLWDFKERKHSLTPSLRSPAASLGDRKIHPCKTNILQLSPGISAPSQ